VAADPRLARRADEPSALLGDGLGEGEAVTDERTLHFALGPVQSFFAQSRRTRDLWSGSYLVSYLSACAVDACEEAGARVVLPHVAEDRLVAAVRAVRVGAKVEGPPPEVGSVPNQVRVEADDPVAVARIAERRVADAWARITGAVWDVIARTAEPGRGTRSTWERQVGSFWQVYWAVGGADALARRKAWRGRDREPEPGDKCTLMAGWQELSGFERAGERYEQDAFWKALRRDLRTFDLGEDERHCALALVKRLFPSAPPLCPAPR
jgi:CRISPR-associated protein Cmr2